MNPTPNPRPARKSILTLAVAAAALVAGAGLIAWKIQHPTAPTPPVVSETDGLQPLDSKPADQDLPQLVEQPVEVAHTAGNRRWRPYGLVKRLGRLRQ